MSLQFSSSLNGKRLTALIRKESLQVRRDPSTVLIAFVLPVILLSLFAYAVSLDIRKVPIGVALETDTPSAHSLAAAFAGSRSFEVLPARDRREIQEGLVSGRIRGFVVIPQDFDQRLAAGGREPLVQIVTDGSVPNTAGFVAAYAQGVLATWQASRGGHAAGGIALEPRYWFNPETESRRVLVPGAIAIVISIIGILLTALVVAREWERGTMEAIISTPASVMEILIGKLLPYFVLGLGATVMATVMAIFLFGVPFRGSWMALFLLSSAFLVPSLGQGLVISAAARNQFVAAQVAVLSGFLPAFLLSGFLYEISSMPAVIRAITYVVPARYFVSSLQTVYLAGDVWPLFIPNILAMLAIGSVFFSIALMNTRKSLDV